MDLSEKKCQPCEGDTPPMDQNEIETFKKHIQDDWNIIENKKMSKEYSFKNFKNTMEFVNKVAELAEEEGHHPDMQVSYGKVVIELSTHAINGLSENDFIMAHKIDNIQ